MLTATQINQEIAAAAATPGGSYVLPAELLLDAGLVIPAGSVDFSLLGAPGGTKVKASGWIGYVVSCGIQAGWNLEPIRSRGAKSCNVAPVADRSTQVTLLGPMAVVAGDYVALMSKQWVTHTNATDSQCNECELSKVVKVDGKTIYLDRPTAREYTL